MKRHRFAMPFFKMTIWISLLVSGEALAVSIGASVPISVTYLPNSLFSSVQITGYRVDDQTFPITGAPALLQGDSYVTPMLRLGHRTIGDEFQFHLLGEVRARNRIAGESDVIVPFSIRYTVQIGQVGAISSVR